MDISILEIGRSVKSRLTFDPEAENVPVWSPDSKQIAYQISRKGIRRKDALGTGEPEILVATTSPAVPLDWSYDGRFLLYGARTGPAPGVTGLWALPLQTAGAAVGKPFQIVSPIFPSAARFSPDAKWVAYVAADSGRQEVYVRPFAPPGAEGVARGQWQVSYTGGDDIAWRRDGKEIFYETLDGDIMAVAVREVGGGLDLGRPQRLMRAGSEASTIHSFDVTPDGQRFLVQLQPTAADQTLLTVVTNWQAALRK
jgi:Tol biopolymer transport system component